MFSVHMLPAFHGDCLWIEYGEGPRPHRVLIDGGTGACFPALKARIEALPPAERQFDLLVITHVDDDHIGGALKLLAECKALGAHFDDLWFNAYPHLEHRTVVSGPDLLGARQGEKLSELIVDAGLPWNLHFGGAAVVCDDDGALPAVTLQGGLKITLLSPYWENLDRLKLAWEVECRRAGIKPGAAVSDFTIDDTLGENVDQLAEIPFEPDAAEANGSSIAFLAEYKGTRVLFGADAWAPVLVRSLARLGHTREQPLQLDALKAPHHGSSHNTNRELIQVAPARALLLSTNGDKFHHPDLVAVARMVKFNTPGATLHFNYATEQNRFWRQATRQQKYRYEAVYPQPGSMGLEVPL